MFRLLLSHLQAFWENRSNIYLYFNALWDPKFLEIVLQECKINKFVFIGLGEETGGKETNGEI